MNARVFPVVSIAPFLLSLLAPLLPSLIGIAAGFVWGRVIRTRLRDEGETCLPHHATGCGPRTQQKLARLLSTASPAVSLWGKVILFGSFVGFVFVLFPLGIGLDVWTYALLATCMFAGMFGFAFLVPLRNGLDHLICPHCAHEMPIGTPWVCPYKNCGARNPVSVSPQQREQAPLRSRIGGVCGHCGQQPAGFLCTACGDPIYFTDEPKRQRPELCAYAVGCEPVTAGEENLAAEQEPLDPFLAAVKELGKKSVSLVEGKRLFLEILADAEKTMDADAYRTFKEMAEDLFAKERRKYTTGRK